MISSVHTRTITVNQSGVARFLVENEGTGILNEMRAKFQICITLNDIPWAPLQNLVIDLSNSPIISYFFVPVLKPLICS